MAYIGEPREDQNDVETPLGQVIITEPGTPSGYSLITPSIQTTQTIAR